MLPDPQSFFSSYVSQSKRDFQIPFRKAAIFQKHSWYTFPIGVGEHANFSSSCWNFLFFFFFAKDRMLPPIDRFRGLIPRCDSKKRKLFAWLLIRATLLSDTGRCANFYCANIRGLLACGQRSPVKRPRKERGSYQWTPLDLVYVILNL